MSSARSMMTLFSLRRRDAMRGSSSVATCSRVRLLVITVHLNGVVPAPDLHEMSLHTWSFSSLDTLGSSSSMIRRLSADSLRSSPCCWMASFPISVATWNSPSRSSSWRFLNPKTGISRVLGVSCRSLMRRERLASRTGACRD